MKIYRQGDVLLRKVRTLPKGLKPMNPENGRFVLAHGEVTGHAHAIADVDTAALLADDAGNLYLEADGTVSLTHEEHGHITIPAGNYRVIRQREYSPEEIRNVAD